MSKELAKRWMNSRHWGGWRAGMVACDGGVFIQYTDECEHFCEPDTEPWLADAARRWWPTVPDLRHPGTRAFLLEDVRKAWGSRAGDNPLIITYGNNGAFIRLCAWQGGVDSTVWDAELCELTEAEALIAALEAAP